MAKIMKKSKEPLVHIAKRDDISSGKSWLIRLAAIVLGLLVVGVVSSILIGVNFFKVYDIMFTGVFGRLLEGKTTLLWRFLQQTAILLCEKHFSDAVKFTVDFPEDLQKNRQNSRGCLQVPQVHTGKERGNDQD